MGLPLLSSRAVMHFYSVEAHQSEIDYQIVHAKVANIEGGLPPSHLALTTHSHYRTCPQGSKVSSIVMLCTEFRFPTCESDRDVSQLAECEAQTKSGPIQPCHDDEARATFCSMGVI